VGDYEIRNPDTETVIGAGDAEELDEVIVKITNMPADAGSYRGVLRSGHLKVTGYYLGRAEQPEGAFLLRTPAANVGLRITSKGTDWSPLVSDEWLKDEVARKRGRRAEPDNPFATD